MSQPLISVIVPVYNVEQYLAQCLDSIIAQTYRNIEIIVVDDGSPDNCPAICDAYSLQDSRIRVIHKQNGGLSSARNAGLEIATGEYIGYVDSDDFIEPQMYEKLLEALECNPNAGAAACRFYLQERGIRRKNSGNNTPDTPIYTADEELILEGLFPKYSVAVWNKLYRREAIKEIRFIEGRNGEDTPYHFHLCKSLYNKGMNLMHIPDYLMTYRKDNPSSICNNKVYPFDLDVLENYKIMLEQCAPGYERELCRKAYNRRLIGFMFRLVLPPLASNKELSRRYFKRLHKELRQISITEIIDVEQNISWKGIICRYMLKYTPTMFRLLVPPAHKLYKQLLIAANGHRTR